MDEARLAQRLHKRVGLTRLANAHDNIEPVGSKDAAAIAEAEIEHDLRVASPKRGNRRHDEARSNRARRVDPHPPARNSAAAPNRSLGGGERPENMAGVVEERASALSEADPPRRPIEQFHAEPRLKA